MATGKHPDDCLPLITKSLCSFRARAFSSQQQPPADASKTAPIYTGVIQLHQRSKPASPYPHSCPSPCRPHLLTVTLQVLHEQLVPRILRSSSSVTLSLLTSFIISSDDGVLQRLACLFLQKLFAFHCRKQESQKTSRELSGRASGLSSD